MVETILGGLGILIGVAVVTGTALDRHAREHAWQRIASARRRNMQKARELQETELALQLQETDLDRRERRVDLREHCLYERELAIESLERELRGQDGDAGLPYSA